MPRFGAGASGACPRGGVRLLKILVVEDELATRRGLVSIVGGLDKARFQLIGEAANGLDGMNMIYHLQPDVVITDIKMPRVNGLDMIENARFGAPGTRYIILSGHSDFEYAKKAIHLAVAEYLLKPVTRQELIDALEALARGSAQQAAERQDPETASHTTPVARAVEAIQGGYARKLSIEELARRMKLTPEYLGALFAKETGKSFSAYLRDVRMEHAKRLLQTTDDKIYEIAYKTGYPDPKYFCKVFKECVGVSAREYARKM